jgi:MFS family permease
MDMRRSVGVLREYDFRQLFLANTVSQLGSQISMLALPLVAVLALHASNFEVGLLAACGTVAFLLVGLPAGVWVDRMRRRSILIFSDVGRALVLSSVPVAWAFRVLTMPQLYLVALVTGVLTVCFDVAYQSYLPDLVGRQHLVEGNAKLESVRSVSMIAAPTIAGLVIQALSAPFAVLLDAASFIGSALFVRRIRRREDIPERTARRHLRKEIVEGLRFVSGNRLLRAIAVAVASYNLLSAARSAMLIVLLARVLRLPVGTIGVFFSIASAGALLGALTARRIAARIGQGPAIWVPIAVAAPFQLLIPMAQRGWLLWLVAVGFGVIWGCVAVNNISQVSFRQGITPQRMLGRMNATMRFLVWGVTPLGSLAGGALGQLIGPRPTLWIAAAGGLIPVLPLVFSPLRTMRELPTLSEHEQVRQPAPPATADTPA